jgi:hypothetical protein
MGGEHPFVEALNTEGKTVRARSNPTVRNFRVNSSGIHLQSGFPQAVEVEGIMQTPIDQADLFGGEDGGSTSPQVQGMKHLTAVGRHFHAQGLEIPVKLIFTSEGKGEKIAVIACPLTEGNVYVKRSHLHLLPTVDWPAD